MSGIVCMLRWRALSVIVLLCLINGCSQDGVEDPEGCGEGMIKGVCGLDWKCIECITAEDCRDGLICAEDGNCVPPECAADADCGEVQGCGDDGLCKRLCDTDMDCATGELCDGKHCYVERCSRDGQCPAGWEPIKFSLACALVKDCPEGLVPGLCGLRGQCVECNSNDECAWGFTCSTTGSCIEYRPCGTENPCATGEFCAPDGNCWPSCTGPWNCSDTSLCVDRDYCYKERCGRRGHCPDGWVPVEGSLECRLSSCEDWGFFPSGCGIQGRCLECITDEHCAETTGYCSPYGFCCPDDSFCTTDDECDGMHERAMCIEHRCTVTCTLDMECPLGWLCLDGECSDVRCQADGNCPEGWKPVYGFLLCNYDPCTDMGMLLGGCGLAGLCIECLTDAQCADGICGLDGQCKPVDCVVSEECEGDLLCDGGHCRAPCLVDEDCADDERCFEMSGACRKVTCNAYGDCSIWGWQPVEGTLACVHDPCYWKPEDYRPGVCGLRERCVQCLVDSDCGEGRFCDLYGTCWDYPCCDEETNRGCANYEMCVDGKCFLACQTDDDCGWFAAGLCMPEGYCFFERCSEEGECPEGWIPGTPDLLPGMLACRKL